MKTTLITLQSATFAVMAKRTLNRKNIRARLVKLDGEKSPNGCTHGIEINEDDFLNAVMVLKSSNIDYYIY